jgi:DNA repair and recombination RAD54-like protein
MLLKRPRSTIEPSPLISSKRSKRITTKQVNYNDENENPFKLLPKCRQPLGQRHKGSDINALSILTKKFKVPSSSLTISSDQHRHTLGLRKRQGFLMRSLYDHTADGAIILWNPEQHQPSPETIKKTEISKKKSISDILGLEKQKSKLVHVTVDPVLSGVLRPHQVEGVRFLYNCTTGKVDPEAFG